MGFSHKVFKVGHSILEEHTASIFMVTESAQSGCRCSWKPTRLLVM